MLKIKVCGLREPQNIKDIVNLNPDFLGFIFYEKSPRCITDFSFLSTITQIKPTIKKVGVFVNEDVEIILGLVDKCKLDIIQLHGFETPEMCAILKSKGLEVWKVFQIDEKFDFNSCKVFCPHVHMFLFDTRAPKGYGGHGKSFDWSLLEQYLFDVPFILAGGISIENMEDLNQIKHKMLAGVDVNSKFELSPGFKDINKLKHLFEFIRK